ncbi:MAG: RNA polymerase factor sigma-54 [Bacteroidales bacterium]|jgi:RNA polymerase sigma-54 factor|nr:RNA polymerase factor sigma-54 [Bacteroidales bacterium]
MKQNSISQTQDTELLLQMQQKIMPQHLLLMKLLQVPAASLEERIDEELEENPALEIATEDENADDLSENTDFQVNENAEESPSEYEQGDIAEETGTNSDLSLEDYLPDDFSQETDYAPYAGGNDREEKNYQYERYLSHSESVQDILVRQLDLLDLSKEDRDLSYFLIGNIDTNGYLTRALSDIVNDLLFTSNISTTVEHLEYLLTHVVQQLDPPGVGARNLQESLLIQLHRLEKGKNDKLNNLAINIIQNAFDDFISHFYQKVSKKTDCTEAQIEEVKQYLSALNPKPFMGLDDAENAYITPDFIVTYNQKTDTLECSLPMENLPPLRVGLQYKKMYGNLHNNQMLSPKDKKAAIEFVRQKLNAAKWFIDALSQRNQTLFNVISAIANHQRDFFLTGEEDRIKPLIYKDIATEIKVDISTISRATRHKYVLTDYGVYPLKFFFTEAVGAEEGSELTAYEIKKHLTEIIAQEDPKKPLNDIEICEKLKERGCNIARRTVAKYRERLHIPTARYRTNNS